MATATLSPLASPGHPVDWFFAFKFNAASFPGCTDDGKVPAPGTKGIFGGVVEPYPNGHSQQYVFATNLNPTLAKGTGCLGATPDDPLGATFGQVYKSTAYNYVLWNDQFKNSPMADQDKPWGHSKGMLAWDNSGNGFVLQVTTPSWPASGSSLHPRVNDGNTLGCIKDDDIEVSQHFFCLKINKADLIMLLNACINASVVTDITKPQLVKNGGPADVQALVKKLGVVSANTTFIVEKFSTGIQVISKPHVTAAPVWQLVSSHLGSVPLRVASWWADPKILSTNSATKITCWPAGLAKPGAIDIALTGSFLGKTFGFEGGPFPTCNHAKIGVSTDTKTTYSIFGDMNQQGTLTPIQEKGAGPATCALSQNGRGGLFYVLNDSRLHKSITSLLAGTSAPVAASV